MKFSMLIILKLHNSKHIVLLNPVCIEEASSYFQKT